MAQATTSVAFPASEVASQPVSAPQQTLQSQQTVGGVVAPATSASAPGIQPVSEAMVRFN